MAMVAAGDAAAAYPGVRFILMQRTARGGFRSTQDTVVALQALSEYAAAIYSRDVKLNVGGVFSVDSSNFDLLQQKDMGTVTETVVEVSGAG